MPNTVTRFKKPPAALDAMFMYGPFEICWGKLKAQGNMLAAIWRREESGQPFEPVSADFVRDFVRPKTTDGSCRLPESDEILDDALRALAD